MKARVHGDFVIKKYGRERIRILRHQKTYSVPQGGNDKEINRLYTMIHDNGAIV